MSGILDKIQNEQKREKEKDNMSFCPNCGKPMIDNTFMRGSRLAGSQHCTNPNCRTRIFF